MGATVHVTVRLPADLMADVTAQAKAQDRSVAWVIASRLRGPVAQLAEQGTHNAKVFGSIPDRRTKCPDKDHHGFQRSDGYWCADCRRMY